MRVARERSPKFTTPALHAVAVASRRLAAGHERIAVMIRRTVLVLPVAFLLMGLLVPPASASFTIVQPTE